MTQNHTTTGQGSGRDRLADTAREAADEVKDKASAALKEGEAQARKLSDEAAEQAEEARRMAGREVRDTSEAFATGAESLDRRSLSGQLMREASRALEDLAGRIEGRDLSDMAGEISGFARRNPAAFLGAAALAGFAVARFATAQPPGRRHEDDQMASTRASASGRLPGEPLNPTRQAPAGTAPEMGPAPRPGPIASPAPQMPRETGSMHTDTPAGAPPRGGL